MFVHNGLVYDRRQTPQSGLSAASIVSALDPRHDGETKIDSGVPGLVAQDVLLEQAENDSMAALSPAAPTFWTRYTITKYNCGSNVYGSLAPNSTSFVDPRQLFALIVEKGIHLPENMRDWQRPLWLADYEDDLLTPEDVAQREGLTVAAVRARFKRLGIAPRSISETRRLRTERDVATYGDEIVQKFFKLRSIDGVSEDLNISRATVETAVARMVPDYQVLSRVPRTSTKKFSNQQLEASLNRAAMPGVILTKEAYETHVEKHPLDERGRSRPGHQVMMLRYGSWGAALNVAGLQANPHFGPNPEFDPGTAIASVVACWTALGFAPTVLEYDAWQRTERTDGMNHPSPATIQKLTGSWNSNLVRCWQIVHDHPLDQLDEDYLLPPELSTQDPASAKKLEELAVAYVRSNEEITFSERPTSFSTDGYNGLERASKAHARLQNWVSDSIQGSGLLPLSPSGAGPLFDIGFVDPKGSLWVIEVKSASASNLDLQLRIAVGQVLHYAFQLRTPSRDVKSAIAIELEPGNTWRELLRTLDIRLLTEGSLESDFRSMLEPVETPSMLVGPPK